MERPRKAIDDPYVPSSVQGSSQRGRVRDSILRVRDKPETLDLVPVNHMLDEIEADYRYVRNRYAKCVRFGSS